MNDNNSKPAVSHTAPAGPIRGDSVTLRVEVEARSRVKNVYVYYKRLPAYYEWLRMEMQPEGQAHFSAAVPLTPEGILYYFEAVDEDGNAVNYPDFLERTPYFIIDSSAPRHYRTGSNSEPFQAHALVTFTESIGLSCPTAKNSTVAFQTGM